MNSDIMYWFENCGHKIYMTKSNQSTSITAVAVSKDTNDIYESSGKDVNKVLLDLKSMLDGKYTSKI